MPPINRVPTDGLRWRKPFAYQFLTLMLVILAVLPMALLLACAPKPQMPDSDRRPQGQAPFGSFNLQQRHGLGGWQGQPGASEQALLQHINETRSPAPETP